MSPSNKWKKKIPLIHDSNIFTDKDPVDHLHRDPEKGKYISRLKSELRLPLNIILESLQDLKNSNQDELLASINDIFWRLMGLSVHVNFYK